MRVMEKFVLIHSVQDLIVDTGMLQQLFVKTVEELDLLVLVCNGHEALGGTGYKLTFVLLCDPKHSIRNFFMFQHFCLPLLGPGISLYWGI